MVIYLFNGLGLGSSYRRPVHHSVAYMQPRPTVEPVDVVAFLLTEISKKKTDC